MTSRSFHLGARHSKILNIILLSGRSGKRLRPLSSDIRSKQFIKIFKKKDGTYESIICLWKTEEK